jgi:hypothetical protein
VIPSRYFKFTFRDLVEFSFGIELIEGEVGASRGQLIEKKIDILENLAEKVTTSLFVQLLNFEVCPCLCKFSSLINTVVT